VSETLEVEGTRTIDIDKFVPEEEIDKRYYERPYYFVPDELPIKARTQKKGGQRAKACTVGVARWDLPAHCGSADPQSMRDRCPGPSRGVADG
jgi:hypothetical protein